MENRKDIEAWADELLDSHRTGPPRPPRSAEDTARAVDQLPATLRFLVEQRGGDPDPEMVERLGRGAKSRPHLESAEALFTVVGVILLGVFLLVASGGF